MAGEIVRKLQDLEKALDPKKLAKEAYRVFSNATPVRTGNARSKTKLSNEDIVANYPYASRLDEGYSKQAPRGMTTPTEEFIQEYIARQKD